MPTELGELIMLWALGTPLCIIAMGRDIQNLNLFPTKPECPGLCYFLCFFCLLKEQKCLGPGKNINGKATSFKFCLTRVHKCNMWIKWSSFWDLFHKTSMSWSIRKNQPNTMFLGNAKMLEFLSLNLLPFVRTDSITTPVACCPRNKIQRD